MPKESLNNITASDNEILFNSITTESTRTIGKQLLLISFVLILSVFDLIKVSSVEVGIVFNFPKSNYYFIAMVVVCSYFLGIYRYSLKRDGAIAHYKRKPVLEKIQSKVESNVLRINELSETINNRLALRTHKQNELNDQDFENYCNNDGVSELQAELESFLHNELKKRTDLVLTLDKHLLFMELWIPCLFATISIVLAICRIFGIIQSSNIASG